MDKFERLFIELEDDMTNLIEEYKLGNIFDNDNVYLSGSQSLKLICEDSTNIIVNDLDIYIKISDDIYKIMNNLITSGFLLYRKSGSYNLYKQTNINVIKELIDSRYTNNNFYNNIIIVFKLHNPEINKYIDIIVFDENVNIHNFIYNK